jgi:hypothetical protein
MEDPRFDGAHSQSKAPSGLLVRESLQFAEQNHSSKIFPEL